MASKLVHLLITFICLTYQIIAREWTNSALTLRYHIWGVVCNFGNDQSEVIVVVTFPDHWLYIMTYTDPNAHFPQIWRRFINTLITQHYISAPELMAYIMGWDPNSTFMCYFLPLSSFKTISRRPTPRRTPGTKFSPHPPHPARRPATIIHNRHTHVNRKPHDHLWHPYFMVNDKPIQLLTLNSRLLYIVHNICS